MGDYEYDPIRDGPQGAPRLPVRTYPFGTWRFNHPAPGDKDILITGPGDLALYVDYDDVNHEQVFRDAKRMVEVLNNAST